MTRGTSPVEVHFRVDGDTILCTRRDRKTRKAERSIVYERDGVHPVRGVLDEDQLAEWDAACAELGWDKGE